MTNSIETRAQMTRRFVIEVTNVNEALVNISIVSKSGYLPYPDNSPRVQENEPVGTVFGTVEVFDYDANETLSFRLDDDSNGMFALSNSGQTACTTIFDKPVGCTCVLQDTDRTCS